MSLPTPHDLSPPRTQSQSAGFVHINEASRRLAALGVKIAPITLRSWIVAGSYPGAQIGSRWYIAESDLDGMIDRARSRCVRAAG